MAARSSGGRVRRCRQPGRRSRLTFMIEDADKNQRAESRYESSARHPTATRTSWVVTWADADSGDEDQVRRSIDRKLRQCSSARVGDANDVGSNWSAEARADCPQFIATGLERHRRVSTVQNQVGRLLNDLQWVAATGRHGFEVVEPSRLRRPENQ